MNGATQPPTSSDACQTHSAEPADTQRLPAATATPNPGSGLARGSAMLLLLFTFLIWSNSFIAVRELVGDFVPDAQRIGATQFVVVRFVPVAILCGLWCVVLPGPRRECARLLRHHWPLILVLGAFNVWGYNLAFAEGHHRVPAGSGSLIITLNPVFTFLIAALVRQERATLSRAIGMTVAFGGIYVVIAHGAGKEVGLDAVTDGLILCLGPLSWAIYTVLGKRVLRDAGSAITLTFLVLALASIPTLFIAAFDTDLHARIVAWSPQQVGAALFLSIACSVLAFWFWFWALKRLTATTTAVFVFLNPPLTVCFEWLWFGRGPTIGLLAGGVLVLAGVYLVIRRRPRRHPVASDDDPTAEPAAGVDAVEAGRLPEPAQLQ